jgi:GTP-binding protein
VKVDIQSAEFITSISDYNTFKGEYLPQIAIAGKSNIGKSSLINSICRRNNLAKTSGTPGKTRLINVFLVNGSFHLIDLPGYGYARVGEQETLRWGTMIQAYFAKTRSLHLVLHLVDIRHEPTQDDITMNKFLRQTGCPFTVIATKADKISKASRSKHIMPICFALQVQPWEVLCYSSENGTGRSELLAIMSKQLDVAPFDKA